VSVLPPPGSAANLSISGTPTCQAAGVLACVQMPTTPQNGTSVQLTFIITNTSTGSPAPSLTIISDNGGAFTGANPGDFPIIGTTCSIGPVGTAMALAAGQSCTVTLTFHPVSQTGVVESALLNIMFQFSNESQATSGTIEFMGTVGGPGVSFSPSPLAFNAQLEGSPTTLTVTVTNTAAANLTFGVGATSITSTTNNAKDFKISTDTCSGTTVVSMGMCSVSVTFTPSTNTMESASLNLADSAVPSPQSDSLTGSGFQPIATLPASAPFNPQLKGTTSAGLTVTLMNTGNGPLTFTSNPSVSGANKGDFGISGANSTCSTANTVAAGSSCTVVLTFTPSTVGAENATLNFSDNAPTVPPCTTNQCVALTGTGTEPVVSLPVNQPFGTVPDGGMSQQVITLTNTGGAPLTFSSNPTVTGPNANDFLPITAMTCSTANTVAAMGAGTNTCTVTLSFKPTTTSAESATLTFTDNNLAVNGSMQTVSLMGTGSPTPAPVVMLPNNVPFGQVPLGANASMTVTLTNTGNAALTFSSNPSIPMSQFSNDFTITGMTCSTANNVPGMGMGTNTCTVTVSFAPSTPAAGGESATLTFVDNSNNVANSMQSVTLTGFGTQPAVTLIPAAATGVNFGTVTQGITSAAKQVTVMNSGNGQLTITQAPAFSGPNAGDFAISQNNCPSGTIVAAGASNCTVMVTFKPSTTAAESATLQFTDNAPGTPQGEPLMGTGQASGMPVVPQPAAVAFGSVPEGVTSATMNVTLQNTGTAALHFTNPAPFISPNGSDFAIVPASTTCVVGTPVNAGLSCVVAVTFTPSTLGVENASVNFADDASPNTQAASLSGTGTGASLLSANISFGTMVPVCGPTCPITTGPVPTFPTMAVQVTNTNTSQALNFASISVPASTYSGDFTVVNGAATTCVVGTPLAAGANCMVTVMFTPRATALTTGAGGETATLQFVDSTGAGKQEMQTASLAGTGVPWVGLTWSDPNASASTDTYNLYRMQVATGTAVCAATLTGYTQVNSAPIPNSSGPSFIDGLTAATAVTQGTSYCYVVTVVNSGGGVSSPTALAAPTVIPAMP
jgi:hypothetical protein